MPNIYIWVMEQLDAIKIVKDIIKGQKRHKNYDRTVRFANEYKTIITGEGIDAYMKKWDKRETEKEYNERKELTINITETVCGNLIDPQKKLSRSNSIERTFEYVDKNKDKFDTLNHILSTFWQGRKSVDSYMAQSWIELNNIDPNTLIVVDWKSNLNGERIKPYPVEYPAEQVYHFNKTNGELNWVCVHRDEQIYDPEMYILYARDFTVIFSRKQEETVGWPDEADIIFYKEFPIEDFNGTVATFKDKDDFWDVHIPIPHNIGSVPAIFVGYNSDMYTRETYLSSIHKAMPILKKIVKANSEFDLTMAAHAFPQKIQYADPCSNCNGSGKTKEGINCEECNGTGHNPKSTHLGALDIVKIPRPRDKEDMVDLSNLVYYVPSDVRLLDFQDRYIDKLTKKCKEAVYNSEVFSRNDVAETAYGKNIDLQNVYDALWSMAEAYADVQNYIVRMIAKITELDQDLIYRISFRKDFKMKSLTDLYNDLEILGRTSADEFVKTSVEDDIAEILYEDNPTLLNRYKTTKYFFPFNGKTKDEIKLVVTSPEMVSDDIRVLWANFAWIFDEIEIEYAKKRIDFYQLPRDKQRDIIQEKINEIKSKLEKPEINVGEIVSAIGREEQGDQGEAE